VEKGQEATRVTFMDLLESMVFKTSPMIPLYTGLNSCPFLYILNLLQFVSPCTVTIFSLNEWARLF